MMAFLTMGAVISIEEIFKCAHMKTMARTSSAVLPLLLSPLRAAAFRRATHHFGFERN